MNKIYFLIAFTLLLHSLSASAMTFVSETEILNLKAETGPVPHITALLCTKPQDISTATESQILAGLSQASCKRSAIDGTKFANGVRALERKFRNQLLSPSVKNFVVEAVSRNLREGKISKEEMAEPGFTFPTVPGVDGLTDFTFNISYKVNGQLVMPTEQIIAERFVAVIEKFAINVNFSDLYSMATEPKVVTNTATEMDGLKGLVGLESVL